MARSVAAPLASPLAGWARDAWLNQVAWLLRTRFLEAGRALPSRFRVVEARGPANDERRCEGAWTIEEDGGVLVVAHVPRAGSERAAAALVHTLAHAALADDGRHGPEFHALARALDVRGGAAIEAGPRLARALGAVLEEAGPLPERLGSVATRGRKKQSVRMLKVECATCGLVARMTRKWLESCGVVHCPSHGPMVVCTVSDEPRALDSSRLPF